MRAGSSGPDFGQSRRPAALKQRSQATVATLCACARRRRFRGNLLSGSGRDKLFDCNLFRPKIAVDPDERYVGTPDWRCVVTSV
jgi:hypothetical protein